MLKRSSKRSPEVNTAAKPLADAATVTAELPKTDKGKDPAAVALGRKGGLKGGKARAASMSAQRRTEIAKKAAASRWSKKPG